MSEQLRDQSDQPRYVCVECKREGTMKEWQERSIEDWDCKPGWTHGRLLKIKTTAADALRDDMADNLLVQLATVGSALCCYMPGAGSPELWPESRCDCKYMHPAKPMVPGMFAATSEETGCAEVRAAYRAVKARFGRDRTAFVEHQNGGES